jgi:hypothetical protein
LEHTEIQGQEKEESKCALTWHKTQLHHITQIGNTNHISQMYRSYTSARVVVLQLTALSANEQNGGRSLWRVHSIKLALKIKGIKGIERPSRKCLSQHALLSVRDVINKQVNK